MVVVIVLSRRIRKYSRLAQDRVGDLTAAVERSISAVRTVRAANAVDREIRTVDDDAKQAWAAGLDVARISAFVVPISSIAMQVSFLVVLGVGGFRVASGAITVAQLVSFILFLFMMIMPLGSAIGAFTSVAQALGALGRIREIIDLPSETADDSPTESIAGGLGPVAVEFDSVSFAYEPDNPILRNVSFTVPTGSRVALVGPSGSGKSTTLSLIERFYDVTEGAVRVGGHDIRALARDELRGTIGYVEQDAPVLAGSVRDNLTLGAPGATDEECLAVLADVNLSNIVERADRGLDAPVGEGGVLLSGGERQRLAIARALLMAPPILLLDESTSSLDGLNEQLMKDAIDRVSANRTLIVIAHRLATVIDSDRIVVLDKGQVLGVGTHDELVASVPLYRELAETQLLTTD
jgi:ATP-binding cassette subfamily B protein